MAVPHEDTEASLPADEAPIVVPSLCMNCHEQGETRILLQRIPNFKEILIESFHCEHCDFHNNSVKFAGETQEQGTKIQFQVRKPEDLQRQIVISEYGVLEVLGIERQPGSGQLTNIEGIIRNMADGFRQLTAEQLQQIGGDGSYEIIQDYIKRLDLVLTGEALPQTVTLTDMSGNSWIEPSTFEESGKYVRSNYNRTQEQNVALGLAGVEDPAEQGATNGEDEDESGMPSEIVKGQVYNIPTSCPACSKPCEVRYKSAIVPGFEEVIVSGTNCDHCGYRVSDVKVGGETPAKGKRHSLFVKTRIDMSRDVLKSEYCTVKIPVLGVELGPGEMGGRFTTVEGLLTQVKDQLSDKVFDIGGEGIQGGDSMPEDTKTKWGKFFEDLERCLNNEIEYEVILEDPMAKSYVQSMAEGDTEDPQLKAEQYDRTWEEEEDLGLHDMQTEDYAEETGDHEVKP